MKRCVFIGHRDYIAIENDVYLAIKKLIDKGVSEFYSGGMGNFDKLCEKAAKQLGGKIIFIPYNVRQIKENDRIWYNNIICPFGEKP